MSARMAALEAAAEAIHNRRNAAAVAITKCIPRSWAHVVEQEAFHATYVAAVRGDAAAAIAAYEAHLAADGWVRVPTRPTDAQIAAARDRMAEVAALKAERDEWRGQHDAVASKLTVERTYGATLSAQVEALDAALGVIQHLDREPPGATGASHSSPFATGTFGNIARAARKPEPEAGR